MNMRAAVAAIMAALVIGASAASRAQQAPAQVLDEIVVNGERTGPGMWHVHRGAAQLWILGSMSPLPRDITWRSKQVEQLAQTRPTKCWCKSRSKSALPGYCGS